MTRDWRRIPGGRRRETTQAAEAESQSIRLAITVVGGRSGGGKRAGEKMEKVVFMVAVDAENTLDDAQGGDCKNMKRRPTYTKDLKCEDSDT